MATVRDDAAFHRQLARQARPATKDAAARIARRAEANLAGHRETGRAKIRVEHGAVDSYVVLDDPASLSIEFGRSAYSTKGGRTVGAMEGLHVLSRALHDA